jgi:hypothetical protein
MSDIDGPQNILRHGSAMRANSRKKYVYLSLVREIAARSQPRSCNELTSSQRNYNQMRDITPIARRNESTAVVLFSVAALNNYRPLPSTRIVRKDKRPNGVVSSDDLRSNRSLLRELHPESHPFQMERLEMIAERDDRLSSHAKEQCRRRGKCAQPRCSVRRARCMRATSLGSRSGARNNNRVCTRGRERARVGSQA